MLTNWFTRTRRVISFVLALMVAVSLVVPTYVSAATYIIGNGVTVPNANVPADGSNKYCECGSPVGTGNHWCCWNYGMYVHYYIWGSYPNRYDNSTHYLRNIPASERTFTDDYLRTYLKDAAPGALLRISTKSDPATADDSGHTLIFVEMNSTGDGAIFLEGNYDGLGRTRLVEWKFADLVYSYGPGSYFGYQYIKYISWPNAPAYTKSCSHIYVVEEEKPTCENLGSRIYSCSKCGDSYTESIPALGHDYQGVETAPTCSSMGFVTYTCSRCGDSYTENDEESWSEWSVVYPEGISDGLIQEKTEYRYRDKEFTTSTSDELDGWTLIGSTTIYGDYGAWSAWGDTPVSASDERKVETRTVWPYYYFLCGNCGAHMHGYGSCYTWAGGCGAPTYESGWREVWSTTPWDSANLRDWYGTGKYYTYVNGELVFQLSNVGSKTQYRYCTRDVVDGYSFYRWGEWSEWNDTACSANSDRNVETRNVYRYYTGPLEEHIWDEGVVTKAPTVADSGICTYTCQVCGVVRTEIIPAHVLPFNDVTSDSFFYEPVLWALENGITTGTSENTFSPNDQCVRAQVVTFLWRAMGSPEPKLTIHPFVDVKPTDFYYKPVLWALENGITSGLDATHFGPMTSCNRAQVVTFLYRIMGNPEVMSTSNLFADVEKGSFYEMPVLWAVENDITTGLSAAHFGPTTICNRAQIVTFLYRAFN